MWIGLNCILEHAIVERLIGARDASTIEPAGANESKFDGEFERFLLDSISNAHQPAEFSANNILGKASWGRTFEEIVARLLADGRVYIEGDGSFVLCGTEPCGDHNRETLWYGKRPDKAGVAPTIQWRSPASDNPSPKCIWRIEGNLCDGASGMDSVSLNGWAPWSEWQQLFEWLGPVSNPDDSPQPTPVLQLHHFGVYLAVSTRGFRPKFP